MCPPKNGMKLMSLLPPPLLLFSLKSNHTFMLQEIYRRELPKTGLGNTKKGTKTGTSDSFSDFPDQLHILVRTSFLVYSHYLLLSSY